MQTAQPQTYVVPMFVVALVGMRNSPWWTDCCRPTRQYNMSIATMGTALSPKSQMIARNAWNKYPTRRLWSTVRPRDSYQIIVYMLTILFRCACLESRLRSAAEAGRDTQAGLRSLPRDLRFKCRHIRSIDSHSYDLTLVAHRLFGLVCVSSRSFCLIRIIRQKIA